MSEFSFPDDLVCGNPTICILNTVIAPMAFFLVGLLIIMGNLLTVLAVFVSEKLRVPSNLHIISLAVADMLIGVNAFTTGSLSISSVLQDKVLVTELCMYDNILWVTMITASNVSLALIAVDRYIYILYPLNYEMWVTVKRTNIVITVTWLSSLVLGLSTLYFRNNIQSGECITLYLAKTGYYFAITTMPYLLVFVFVCGAYTRIILVSFSHRNKINASNMSTRNLWRLKLKNLKLLLTVCGLYLCCWLPFHIFSTMYMATGVLHNALLFTSILGLVNSLVNVLIYPWMNNDFRAAYATILCYCKRR